MPNRDATLRTGAGLRPARGSIRISELQGPHGEMYMAAVDSRGHVRLEVHVHDPADEQIVVRLLELYLATADTPSPQLRLI